MTTAARHQRPGVSVVTDSTSSLTPDEAAIAGVRVVPLQVVIDGTSRAESFAPEPGWITPGEVAAALRAGRQVSTSRPSPEAFEASYLAAVEAGAEAIVSIHLSSQISGTFEAAQLAARAVADQLPAVRVDVVDSRTVGPGCGRAALAAARLAAAGADLSKVTAVARGWAAASATYFCVEDLDYLRRGGRIGAARALLGSVLAMKPILTMDAGVITGLERARTMSRAVVRLAALADLRLADPRPVELVRTAAESAEQTTAGLDAAGFGDVGPSGLGLGDVGQEVTVLHLDNPLAAARLAGMFNGTGTVVKVAELSSVLGVHCGPGTLGIVVGPAVSAAR